MDEWIESDSGNYSMALSQTRESLRLCWVRLWNPFDCACASRFRFGNCTIALIQARKQYDCGESYSAYNTSACLLCITVYNTRAYVLCITVYNRLSTIQFTFFATTDLLNSSKEFVHCMVLAVVHRITIKNSVLVYNSLRSQSETVF